MKFNWKTIIIAILAVAFIAPVFFSQCKPDKNDGDKPSHPTTPPAQPPKRLAPNFSADSAYGWIEKQLSFGYRVPNMKSHKLCAAWLAAKFKEFGGEVVVQSATLTAGNGDKLAAQNIIASFNPQAKTRVMLSAHWDSRPWADEDTERKKEPILAANDAGSGVAVLLELARNFQQKQPNIGVDIFLWDAEDYGIPEVEDSYCLGTQYWAKNKHKAGYTATYGVNLDMVGAEGATFPREEASDYFARTTADKLWSIAHELGYGNYFLYNMSSGVTDDHLYVNTVAKIPMIDVIDRRATPTQPQEYRFFPYWHTHKDDIHCISKETLKAVGQPLMEMIYRE